MISDIRPYVRGQLLQVNSDYVEWTDALNFANIPSHNLERTYHLEYSLDAIEKTQLAESYSINMTIRLFSKGSRDTVSEYDTLMDRAELVKNQIVNYANISDDYVGIEANSITIEPISDSNDNKMIATINLVATKINCIS